MACTQLTTDDRQLATVSNQRYLPFGEVRDISTQTGTPLVSETDFGYTGQRNYAGFALMDYNARFYSPTLGRFTQPDTIIPDPTNTQALNRYSYVINNPINYTDPSGHKYCDLDGLECEDHGDDGLYGSDEDWDPRNWSYGGGGSGIDPSCDPSKEDCKLLTDEMMAKGAAFAPGLETVDDVLTVLTGCGIACQAGYEDTVKLEWRLFAAAGLLLPVSGRAIGGVFETAGDAFRKLCSFDAQTLVMTDEGLVNISEIEIGDYVLAFNEETGETDFFQVTAVWAHQDEEITYLIINGELIITTPDHPFYTSEGEWVAVADLAVGDEVVQANGEYSLVESNTSITQTGWMYNLTVDAAHTYFVGDGQWLVHNDCPNLISLLGNDSRLIKEARKLSGLQQVAADNLVEQLAKGNLNPGIGTKRIFGNVFEARARNGARVYFSLSVDGIVQILAKSTKENQSKVINMIRELYE